MKKGQKRKIDPDNSSSETETMICKAKPLVSLSKLTEEFFDVPCYNLANFLLGKFLVRKLGDKVLKSKIVETECYLGGDDKASFSFGGRRSAANEPMYMSPGTAFVYMTYGMYHCFNISSSEPGAAVLLRATEPLEGIDMMRELRMRKRKSSTSKALKDHELCNGPSKLCMSMDIEKNNCNKLNLCTSDVLWIESDLNSVDDFKTIITKRIGIDRVEKEWANKPLRFYIYGNKNVSKRDQNAEKLLNLEIVE